MNTHHVSHILRSCKLQIGNVQVPNATLPGKENWPAPFGRLYHGADNSHGDIFVRPGGKTFFWKQAAASFKDGVFKTKSFAQWIVLQISESTSWHTPWLYTHLLCRGNCFHWETPLLFTPFALAVKLEWSNWSCTSSAPCPEVAYRVHYFPVDCLDTLHRNLRRTVWEDPNYCVFFFIWMLVFSHLVDFRILRLSPRDRGATK